MKAAKLASDFMQNVHSVNYNNVNVYNILTNFPTVYLKNKNMGINT